MFDSLDFKKLKELYFSTDLQRNKEFAHTLENVAVFIDQEKYFCEGLEFFTKVNDTIAENPYCYRYIGNIYRLQEEFEKSLKSLLKAAAMSEGTTLHYEVLYNLGMLYREHNKLIQARECFEKIVKVHPQSAMVHNSLSCLSIYEGRFYEGWKKHVWRIQLDSKMQRLKGYFQLPEWENKTESHILILPEQGIGDKIMFSTFFSLLPKSKKFTAVVSTRLLPIFQRSFPAINVIEGTQENIAKLKLKNFDAYCFMGCLPRVLNRTTPENSPFLKPIPYRYKVNTPKTPPTKKRIGISWRGGTNDEKQRRSIGLDILLPILKTPGVSFINLQYDAQQSEIASLKSHGIDIISDETVNALENIDVFSSLASSCDVIITVDNSTAHLAGAIGIPTWVLLSNAPNWRWQKSGNKSFWYQSLTLFRQNDTRCWEDVVKKVAAQLKTVAI